MGELPRVVWSFSEEKTGFPLQNLPYPLEIDGLQKYPTLYPQGIAAALTFAAVQPAGHPLAQRLREYRQRLALSLR